jgi:hypothetical protein
VLAEILEALGTAERPGRDLIRREDVSRWMSAADLEAQGALFTLLMTGSHHTRIEPPLQFGDCHSFVMQYFERCLREDPDGDWSDTRYTAGWSLVTWFKGLWFDSAIPRSALADLKAWIGGLYREGDEDIRTCLVTATLEHLFEEPAIVKYFADWRNDDELKRAFDEAMEWQKPESARRGGS